MYYHSIFFFFSSRRRHTRFDCDWSSDVCSSDLRRGPAARRDEDGSRPHPDRPPVALRTPGDVAAAPAALARGVQSHRLPALRRRSEEHTSELQSQSNLVCRLLLEKKKEPTRADGGAAARATLAL